MVLASARGEKGLLPTPSSAGPPGVVWGGNRQLRCSSPRSSEAAGLVPPPGGKGPLSGGGVDGGKSRRGVCGIVRTGVVYGECRRRGGCTAPGATRGCITALGADFQDEKARPPCQRESGVTTLKGGYHYVGETSTFLYTEFIEGGSEYIKRVAAYTTLTPSREVRGS